MNDFPIIPSNKRLLATQKLVYGVGKNDADYLTQPTVDGKKIECPFYTTWKSMLKRCYSEKYQKSRPTYIGCSVCEEWHSFMVFRSWMIKQNWKGMQLDKDLLFTGNKIHSSETCVFVDNATNSLLTHKRVNKGKYATGVSLHKASKKFIAKRSGEYLKGSYIGIFNTEPEAESAYLEFKSKVVISVAIRQPDRRVFIALLKVAKGMRDNIADNANLKESIA